MPRHRVASPSDIPPDEVRGYRCGDATVAVVNVDGQHYAIDSVCPHREGPLDEGLVEGATVICPWHGWTFDVTTGVSPEMPAAKVKTYPVTVEGDDLHIDVD